ncbi:MAG: MTH938/NDUFAF3 family protein [Candidatus Promineifilaceae bacterium]
MKTETEATSFGSITIDGQKFDHDVIIRLDGTIRKRKKKLSKRLYGTSHKISRSEADFIYEDGAQTLIVGTGQYDQVRLSDEAQEYFDGHGVKLITVATPEAIRLWNDEEGAAIGLFHVTC